MRIGSHIGLLIRLLVASVAAGPYALPLPANAQGGQFVDLELALLVDVSASVNDEEYLLQAKGLASALRSPAVLGAIKSVIRKGVAITVIQWSDEANQRRAIDWSLIRGDADALWLASQVDFMPRLISGGHTALSSALTFAAAEIESNGFTGLRRIIDLSGDGRNNAGPPLRSARREVLSLGITINGLAILNELPFLDRYFRDHLIGGDGAFHLISNDYHAFAQAMSEKLAQEIRSVPLSENDAPNTVPKQNKDTSIAARSDDKAAADFGL